MLFVGNLKVSVFSVLNHHLICWPAGFQMTPNFHKDIAGPVYFREFNEVGDNAKAYICFHVCFYTQCSPIVHTWQEC